MKVSPVLAVLVCTVAIAVAQSHDDKKPPSYDSSYPGYDSKKQSSYSPSSHSSNKQSGSYPGAYPDSYQHQKTPGHGGYRPPYYGGGHSGYGGYGQGGYGGYGGGYNQWKHYEYCTPDYDSYSVHHRYNVRYLESATEDQLNQNTSAFLPPPGYRGPRDPPCERGPKHVLHSVHYEWHWPPIYVGVCDDLPGCKDPKCIAKKTVKRAECVLVFRRYGYRWVKVGYRKIVVKSDVSCKCRECRDIKSYRECVHTHPCPNSRGGEYSYCFWKRPYNPYSNYGDSKKTPGYGDDHDKKQPTYPPGYGSDHKKQPTYPPGHRDQRDIEDELPEYDDIDSETVSIDETELDDVAVRSKRNTHGYGYDRYDHYGDKKNGYDTDPYDTHKHPLYPVPAGYCDCCIPKLCIPPRRFDYDICDCVCPKKKCLPGHTFNPKTCKCECPKGTYLDKKKQKCIGICKQLTPKACETVLCKDNPHFYCKLDKKYNCRCPSCYDVDYWQRGLCKKTNCIEQGYKPYCVFDWRNGKCRCPECEDQKNPQDCEKTSCIDPYKNTKKCKWVWYPYPTCQCAEHYPRHDSKSTYPPTHGGYGDDDKKRD